MKNNITEEEFVRSRLSQDFTIINVLPLWEKILKELQKDDGMKNDSFQKKLDKKVYPLLACFKGLKEAGVSEDVAFSYTTELTHAYFGTTPESMRVAGAI